MFWQCFIDLTTVVIFIVNCLLERLCSIDKHLHVNFVLLEVSSWSHAIFKCTRFWSRDKWSQNFICSRGVLCLKPIDESFKHLFEHLLSFWIKLFRNKICCLLQQITRLLLICLSFSTPSLLLRVSIHPRKRTRPVVIRSSSIGLPNRWLSHRLLRHLYFLSFWDWKNW